MHGSIFQVVIHCRGQHFPNTPNQIKSFIWVIVVKVASIDTEPAIYGRVLDETHTMCVSFPGNVDVFGHSPIPMFLPCVQGGPHSPYEVRNHAHEGIL